MSTLQYLKILLNFNRLSTHRKVSIGFLKYIGNGLTLQYIAKKRATTAPMNVDLTEKDVIVIQQSTENDMTTTMTTHANQIGK